MTRNIREASATTLPTIAVVAVLLYVVWNMPDTDRTKLEAVVKLASATATGGLRLTSEAEKQQVESLWLRGHAQDSGRSPGSVLNKIGS